MNKLPIEIKKFSRPEFGTLTTIKNDVTGVIMFIGPEVAKMWGHSNLRVVIGRLLDKSEYKLVLRKEYPEFFNELVRNKLLRTKVQNIQLITESALYKLALASNLEKAKPFRNWITQEVIPSIRKTGQYTIADQYEKLAVHQNINVQKFNSKAINAKNFTERGLDYVIDYNRQSCLLHTGKTPHQLKEIGRKIGLSTKELSSGKEVLRHIDPARAAAMSFTDSQVKEGLPLKAVAELSIKCIVPLYNGLNEISKSK